MPNPLSNPSLFDYILLAGKKSPGIAKVSGSTLPRNWYERKGNGSSGATLTYTGEGLAKFSVTFELITEQEFDEWEDFALLLKKAPSSKNPQALDISHPWLEQLNIKSVVIENIGQIEESGDTRWSVKVDFKQYRAPKPAAAVAKGSKATGGKSSNTNNPPAKDAYDLQIDALMQQLTGKSQSGATGSF